MTIVIKTHFPGLKWNCAASCTARYSSRFKNKCFAVMRSGSEQGSYLRLADVCITLFRPRVKKKKKKKKHCLDILAHKGTSLIRNRTPHRTAIRPCAYAYCRILRGGVFL